jgi:hypothetical protein
MFEDTKGGQKEKDKRINNDKTKYRLTQMPLKPGVNPGAPEG